MKLNGALQRSGKRDSEVRGRRGRRSCRDWLQPPWRWPGTLRVPSSTGGRVTEGIGVRAETELGEGAGFVDPRLGKRIVLQQP
jgi:hypothetical protein